MNRQRARRSALVVALALAAGCTQTMRDYFDAEPLKPIPVHQGMEAKEQCMHCHTQQIAEAPVVPHPQYERCVLCHTTEALAVH